MSEHRPQPETDPRFPSGRWIGFFVQKSDRKRKYSMELELNFSEGVLHGEGRDLVGVFLFKGRYNLDDGRCYWTKQYVGRHEVLYEGFNEGQGIWGAWTLPGSQTKGGFHIWPEDMTDPTGQYLHEHAELPAELVSV